jgi:hypothetical protein
MNPAAIFFGLSYAVLSAVAFYAVSMLTSGLFARPLYRLYSRVLIAICCIMMAAPPLRWLASLSPTWGVVGLTLTQYLAVGILIWGVFRFNRDFLKQIFLKRATTAYFTFGTLANALVVTLAFLQVAVSGAPTWGIFDGGRAYLTVGHYGPILLLVAAMVLHTDYRLKICKRQPLHFSRFSFVGYALSFMGIALSLLPYMGQALTVLGLSSVEWQLLQNASCAQSLLIAIVVFGWLVWRYESIPPLFVFLFAIVCEYHVLVTQWSIRWLGVESWGLATLPLLLSMAGLYRYFRHWDQRKRLSRNGVQNSEAVSSSDEKSLRFVLPFQVVYALLGLGLLTITLWSRLAPSQLTSPIWAGITFGVYALYFYGESLFRRDEKLLYAAGLLAVLAALLGFTNPAVSASIITLGLLAFAWGLAALVGDRMGLKSAWRTPLADCSLAASVIATGAVFFRHLGTSQPYYFGTVSWQDGLACLLAVAAFAASAHQYRSRLPVYGGLLAMATIAPMLSAGIALVVKLLALLAERRLPEDNAITFEGHLRFLNRSSLPGTEKLPGVFVNTLSVGAIPLALIGLTVSMSHLARFNMSPLVLLGLATSSLTLGLQAFRQRAPWLLGTSLLAAYLTVHATFQAYLLGASSTESTIAAHMLIAAVVSTLTWIAACGNSLWCDQLLMLAAEECETDIRERKKFYSGWLQRIAILANLGVFSLTAAASGLLIFHPFGGWTAGLALAALILLALFFAHVDHVYRTQLGSYLALSSIGLAILWISDATGAGPWNSALLFSVASVLAGFMSAIIFRWQPAEVDEQSVQSLGSLAVLQIPLLQPVKGWNLWHRPLAVFAVLFGAASLVPFALFHGYSIAELASVPVTCLAIALSSMGSLLSTNSLRLSVIYVCGICLAFLAAHAGMQWLLLDGQWGTQILAAHLLLASLLCLLSAVIANLTAAWLNRRLRFSEDPVAKNVLDLREFYSGLLHHVALVVGCGILVTGWMQTRTELTTSSAAGFLLPCSVLVLYFAFSGANYRSRIQAYLTLATLTLAALVACYTWLPTELLANVREPLFAILALVFGVVALIIRKSFISESENSSARSWQENRRLPQCFSEPPLPLLSLDRLMWAVPLTQSSIVLAAISTLSAISGGPQSDLSSSGLTLLVSAIALLLATETFRLNTNATDILRSDMQSILGLEQVLRGGLLLAALTVFTTAVYVTVDNVLPSDIPLRLALGWYQVLSAFLAFLLWCLSAIFLAWTRKRLAIATLSEKQRQQALSDAVIYSTLPHGLAWLLTLLLVVLGTVFAFSGSSVIVQTLVTLFLTGLTLGLMAGSQRSWLTAYASLIAFGLALVMLPVMMTGADLRTFDWSPELLSVLGISWSLSALMLRSRNASVKVEGIDLIPNLAELPEPSALNCWPAIWFPPLRDLALVSVLLSSMLAGWEFRVGEPALWPPARILVTCYLAAATFFVLTRLYAASWPTYVGCITLVLSMVPALAFIAQPMALIFMAWALLGLVVWTASLAIEKTLRPAMSDWTDQPLAIKLYERPLLRSSAVVAMLAVVTGLTGVMTSVWQVTPLTAAVACMLATINLLLCARSANVIHRETLASGLVYFACIVTAAGTLVLVSASWDLSVAALAGAILSLAMTTIGVVLVELDRRRTYGSPIANEGCGPPTSQVQHASWQALFGQPIAFSGLSLSFIALAVSVTRSLNSSSFETQLIDGLQVGGEWFWHQAIWMRTAASLLLASLTWLVGSRSYVRPVWLHLGVSSGMIGLILFHASAFSLSPAGTVLIALLVSNCLIWIARWIHVHPTQAEAITLAKSSDSELCFFAWPVMVSTLLLGIQLIHLVNVVQGQATMANFHWLLSSLLTAGFFYQALYREPKTIWLNMLIAATSIGVSLGGIVYGRNIAPVDVGLAILGFAWGAIAVQSRQQLSSATKAGRSWILSELVNPASYGVMAAWSTGLLLAALIASLPVAWYLQPSWPNCSLTFLLVASGLAAASYAWRSNRPIPFSMALIPASIGYTTYYYGAMGMLVEYFGPLLLGVAIFYAFLGQRLARLSSHEESLIPDLAPVLSGGADVGIGLSLVASASLIPLNEFNSPAALTLFVAGCCWLWRAIESGREAYVYLSFASVMFGALATAHFLFELPFGRSALLSFGVIGISFLCIAINILAGRELKSPVGILARPCYFLALGIPGFLLATIPFDNRELTAYCTLAGGAFYLFVAHRTGSRWPVYVATILFNVAIYFWVPALKETTGLFQLYVFPVAISILLIAQLHWQELRHSALNSIRYAAAGAILAASTLEVFMSEEPSLLRFIVVLALSLLGTAAGIALRVRPFVFLGLAFLTLNVIGQLGVQFQREGGIIRAVILIVVGILVLAVMIFFNIHRERLLKRYRHFLTDSQWE